MRGSISEASCSLYPSGLFARPMIPTKFEAGSTDNENKRANDIDIGSMKIITGHER